MNIILLSGGLGNQMFQYAFGLSIKKRGGKIMFNDYLIKRLPQHNGLELNHVFGITFTHHRWISLGTRILRKLELFKDYKIVTFFKQLLSFCGIRLSFEKGNSVYAPSYQRPEKYWHYLWGYWQSEKYFQFIETEIRQIFTFNPDKLGLYSQKTAREIQQTESVSIHIRRGDYLSKDSPYNGICTLEYYKEAIELITKKVKNPSFFIFSDDMEWVKQHLCIDNARYIDKNTGEHSWEDMYLMSICKHNIIANSSFSWWGAWLNPNKNKTVIAPAHFLNTEETPDILPETWIKIKQG